MFHFNEVMSLNNFCKLDILRNAQIFFLYVDELAHYCGLERTFNSVPYVNEYLIH